MYVLVTGAGRGIGAAVVNEVLALGYGVIRVSRSLPVLAAHGSHVVDIAIDLLQPDAVHALVNKLMEAKVSPAAVIHNAGMLINKPFATLTEAEELQMMQLNVLVPARLTRALLPVLQRPAHVVNIGSMGGFQGSSKFPGLSMYSASKAALACLTECLAEEFKNDGISFNCLALGAVQTEMLAEAFPGYQAPVSPAQMARFIVDFTLHQSTLFNGKVLPVSVNTP